MRQLKHSIYYNEHRNIQRLSVAEDLNASWRGQALGQSIMNRLAPRPFTSHTAGLQVHGKSGRHVGIKHHRGSNPFFRARMAATEPQWQSYRWEGDWRSRPLGQMERLLNARRSWSGSMVTPHVAAAVLHGPPPTEGEMLQALEWILKRHPLLASCVRGKSHHYVPDALPYPMHSNYLDRALHYGEELFKPEPNKDIQRFEPSQLSPAQLARRALRVIGVETDVAVEAAWQRNFETALDETTFDEEGDGPLWRMTLYYVAEANEPCESAVVYQANHAVSDQLSFNIILSEMLDNIASHRAGSKPIPPVPLPLPPSVEGALLGKEQRQGENIKSRLELIIGSFVDGGVPANIGGMRLPSWAPNAIPTWKTGRVRPSTIQYGLWQAAASGFKKLPRWVPADELSMVGDEAKWEHKARRTRSLVRTIDSVTSSRLVRACRAKGTTVGGALCAAAALGASDAMGTASNEKLERYKLLQALDMRTLAFDAGGMDRPGARDDWSNGSVVAGTGSLDILIDLPPFAGESARNGSLDLFWSAAAECNKQTKGWISSGWGRESLLLFSCGWEFMNMNRVVELGSQDRGTLGRAFSAGVSNAGRYAHPTKYGNLQLSRLHFAISQSVSAPAISTSAVTVDGVLCLTVTYSTPIWDERQAQEYADNLVKLLEAASFHA